MNHLYEQLLNKVDVGIHVINDHGKTIIYNKKMMEIESMEASDVLGKDVREVFSFNENQHSTLVHTLKTGEVTKGVRQTYFNNKGQEITTINDTFPFLKEGKITEAVEIAKDVTQLEHVIKENVLQKKNTHYTFDRIIGQNEEFLHVIDEAKRATRTTSSVLIIGETGTGKELFAQSIHNGSSRSHTPFIAQNCAAIPENLLESLLFGTKKGAFTDAIDSPGLFEQADGGTLLLDEINSLDFDLQAKLLRVLQEKTIRRIGDTKDKKVDVRIIATMNEDPAEILADKRIRKDLYYRLSVVTLYIPPLRERKKDIMPLAQEFINKYNVLFHMSVREISEEAKILLHQHDWQGNVRELEHTIEGAMNQVIDEEVIQSHHLPIRLRKRYQDGHKNRIIPEADPKTETLKDKMEELEKAYIRQVLAEHQHNITRTAKILGMSRQSLQYRIKKFGI
ncbi:PAS domain-containing protein [Oceanobacillus piezotolerans]|uniref:PAS domain-containing protein n=2 Tax=Oceanobacillus piezotolerans TaxID=2448030 RepID=A0A498DGT4_9BACI|nr:sigma 54-interacting transcriptional regulator [Oceanobacillus piezotolerans]RLL47151.1 PAS domain-containing protein [Oceanobacillus piezotolerans]